VLGLTLTPRSHIISARSAIADPVFARPAHTHQDDRNRKAAAPEDRQQDGSSIGHPSLHCQG
jgi:hypothetical protein